MSEAKGSVTQEEEEDDNKGNVAQKEGDGDCAIIHWLVRRAQDNRLPEGGYRFAISGVVKQSADLSPQQAELPIELIEDYLHFIVRLTEQGVLSRGPHIVDKSGNPARFRSAMPNEVICLHISDREMDRLRSIDAAEQRNAAPVYLSTREGMAKEFAQQVEERKQRAAREKTSPPSNNSHSR